MPARPAFVEALIAALLLVSIPSFVMIPFLPPLGLDFQNLYLFHQCAGRDNPYLVSGVLCGDPGGRDMVYPPLLYWSFAWVRPLQQTAATLLWMSAVAIGTLGALWPFAPPARWRQAGGLGLFTGLLAVQYPLVFGLERGNNDVLVLVCWALAAWGWQARRPALGGLAAGLAISLKLYPAFAALVVGTALLVDALRTPDARRDVLRFAAGGLAGVLLPALALYPQVKVWATTQLPAFAAQRYDPAVWNHAMNTLRGTDPFPLQAILVVAWLVGGALAMRRDPVLVFAGALAISTSFANTSWDYNLVTAYPLLVVQYQRAAERRWRPLGDALLILGVVAVVGNRVLFSLSPGLVQARVLLLWGWMTASGALAAWLAVGPDAEAAPAEPPASGAPA
jgi:hypothetical protein